MKFDKALNLLIARRDFWFYQYDYAMQTGYTDNAKHCYSQYERCVAAIDDYIGRQPHTITNFVGSYADVIEFLLTAYIQENNLVNRYSPKERV